MVLQESSEWRVGKVGQLIIDLSGRHGFRLLIDHFKSIK
jgi:hypothetical protein